MGIVLEDEKQGEKARGEKNPTWQWYGKGNNRKHRKAFYLKKKQKKTKPVPGGKEFAQGEVIGKGWAKKKITSTGLSGWGQGGESLGVGGKGRHHPTPRGMNHEQLLSLYLQGGRERGGFPQARLTGKKTTCFPGCWGGKSECRAEERKKDVWGGRVITSVWEKTTLPTFPGCGGWGE